MRTFYPQVPPRVEYQLAKGSALDIPSGYEARSQRLEAAPALDDLVRSSSGSWPLNSPLREQNSRFVPHNGLTPEGKSVKTTDACGYTRGSVRRASGFILTNNSEIEARSAKRSRSRLMIRFPIRMKVESPPKPVFWPTSGWPTIRQEREPHQWKIAPQGHFQL